MRRANGFRLYDADDSHLELLRAVTRCHPGWDGLAPATFMPDGHFSPSWLRWKQQVFAPVLLFGVQGARVAAAGGDCRALAVCDHAVDVALEPRVRDASRVAGGALMEEYSAPNSEKLWSRYRSLWSSGEVPGHLAIVCALRGAAFHLSSLAIVSAYIFLEARAGLPGDGVASWMSMVGDCLTECRGLPGSNLRAA